MHLKKTISALIGEARPVNWLNETKCKCNLSPEGLFIESWPFIIASYNKNLDDVT